MTPASIPLWIWAARSAIWELELAVKAIAHGDTPTGTWGTFMARRTILRARCLVPGRS